MFYENQPLEQQKQYKEMLEIVGSLSLLYSENECPYLYYRCHENVFCKYFEADNLSRSDCSADAKKKSIGIGLKTWMGNDDQKVAEFGKLRSEYEDLRGMELVKRIAEYRNNRIRITKNLYGIDEMIYHVVKRVSGAMKIMEHAFDYIDIDSISLISDRGNDNNIYFTDGNHTYHFSLSKNTLFMIFSDLQELDNFPVKILPDPYSLLMNLKLSDHLVTVSTKTRSDIGVDYVLDSDKQLLDNLNLRENQICLRLYSVKQGKKIVPLKSGLNQWNAAGRVRNANELYIPYPAKDKRRRPDFFPDRDVIFELKLPDGTIVPAKVCQDGGKAIMSNPNKTLGEWLLRKVFELPENTIVTYQMLQHYGIDSVIFTKESELHYSIDFATLGTYETSYRESITDLDDNEE